jgi:hypothetical protein
MTMAEPEDRTKALHRRQLELLLQRELGKAYDILLGHMDRLVESHFEQLHRNDNLLTNAQLQNLEAAARMASSVADTDTFIRKQAEKESHANDNKKKWTHNNLHQQLLKRTAQTIGRGPRKSSGSTGLKDDILTEIEDQAVRRKIPPDDVQAWRNEREQEIRLQLLRRLTEQFNVLYRYKAMTLHQPTAEGRS